MSRPPRPTNDELVSEQAANQRYLTELDRRAGTRIEVVGPANTNAYASLRLPLSGVAWSPLIGRVGMSAVDADDPLSMYIGPRFLEGENFLVVSWAAPAARVFFEGQSAPHPFAKRVVVVRTMTTHADDIVAIDDDWVRAFRGQSPFAITSTLSVPAAPTSRRAPVAHPSRTIETATEVPTAHEAVAPMPEVLVEADDVLQAGGIRAEDAVLRSLAAPRTGHMASVLATLQADQYDIVTRPSDPPLIVLGHPGTGKTVVAVHRAAYLVHPDNASGRPQRVLFLGPTREWVDHVRPILAELLDQSGTSKEVDVKDLAGWLAETAGLKDRAVGVPDGLSDEVEHRLAGLASSAARKLAERHGWSPMSGSRQAKVRAIYEEMRELAQSDSPLVKNSGVINALRPWQYAVHDRRLLPVLAQCAIALFDGTDDLGGYDHIVVDEAQDLTRMEWTIVAALNRGSQWTLVGDMNQRRTDRTHTSWESLQSEMGIEAVTPTLLMQGFRSTQQILEFASKLLPNAERDLRSLQTGPPVLVERSRSAANLTELAIKHANRLARAYPKGSVAIYTEHASDCIPALNADGWRKVHADQTILWHRDDEKLSLHTPVSGRGIEFDAVVAIEPADYPQNLGRNGPLYTTLTRANRELAVVFHNALPDGLARAARKKDR